MSRSWVSWKRLCKISANLADVQFPREFFSKQSVKPLASYRRTKSWQYQISLHWIDFPLLESIFIHNIEESLGFNSYFYEFPGFDNYLFCVSLSIFNGADILSVPRQVYYLLWRKNKVLLKELEEFEDEWNSYDSIILNFKLIFIYLFYS